MHCSRSEWTQFLASRTRHASGRHRQRRRRDSDGATLSGVVTQVERAGRVQGRAQLAFVFTRLEADGVGEDVNTAPVAYVADSTKVEDAAKIGVGAVGGATVGGILGGATGRK
jgi:hypothetical protein